MEIDEENIVSRRCYRLENPIFDNLNIIYNNVNSMIVLWNKYQIFIYTNLQSPPLKIVPDFQLYHLIALVNYLVCLDNDGNVHFTPLKFKNTHQSCKIPFQPRDQNIKTCSVYKQLYEYIICLKYEADTYFLHLYKVNSNFQIEKSVILLSDDNNLWSIKQNTTEKYRLIKYSLDGVQNELLKTLFNVTGTENVIYDLLILSYDNFSVYGCLFSPKMDEEEVTLVKLYNCPAEICSLEIITQSGELYLIIALTMGTIIRLSLNNVLKPADIIHLNTSLCKTLTMKDSIIYSDGESMWKTVNTFSDDRKFIQFFVQDVKDFVKCGDQIICTTFTKLLYTFYLEDRKCLIIPKTVEEYCSAEKILNHAEHFKTLFQEVDENVELQEKIKSEQTYISALALSNRQAVVKKAIESSVVVYENYEDIDKTDIKLTEEIKEYFLPDTWIFLVKISNSGLFDILNGILTRLSESIHINITIFDNNSLLKISTLKLEEPLKQVSFIIPLLRRNYDTDIKVNIKIIIKIPGPLDGKPAWTVLYRNDIILNCEHFVKLSKNTAVYLKNPTEPIEKVINEINIIEHGSLFDFNDTSQLKDNVEEWSFYVKLPKDYCLIFLNENLYKRHFHPKKSALLHEKLSDQEFLTAKNNIILAIGNEKITIKIQNDGFFNPLLVVTSKNMKIAFNLRNFFSNLLYNNYEDQAAGKEFISIDFYTTTENLQKAVKDYIINSSSTEDFISLIDKFEKYVVAHLPI